MRKSLNIALLVAMTILMAIPAVAAEKAAGKVNINTATVEQLQLLPRIGPKVAERIVQWREDNGKFVRTTDLMQVRGIGDSTFSLLEPHISVEGESTLSEKVPSPRKAKPTNSAD